MKTIILVFIITILIIGSYFTYNEKKIEKNTQKREELKNKKNKNDFKTKFYERKKEYWKEKKGSLEKYLLSDDAYQIDINNIEQKYKEKKPIYKTQSKEIKYHGANFKKYSKDKEVKSQSGFLNFSNQKTNDNTINDYYYEYGTYNKE